MKQTTNGCLTILGFLASLTTLTPVDVTAATLSPGRLTTSADLAFARYISSMQERDPFRDSGPVAVEIDASLPGLYKETRFLAVREIGDSERNEYHVLQIEGDPIVAQEVIARYLLIEEQLDELPFSSVAITPANYRFRYKGEVGTGSALAYVYEVSPKRRRDGLIEGEVWIDSETGAAVLQSGRLVASPRSFNGKIEFVREIDLHDGIPVVRVTHMNIGKTQAGRGELKITEMPLKAGPETQTDPQPAALTHQ
ncbi:MAG: hypothetical protein JOZ32_15365 [Bryobacterales bacterium]|nr:hypothetical protein [Bryobacterales bacterium]